ncbi:MAG: NADH-quinone oxidoreductase subunit L [Aggregatilineales bacterium]
MNSIAPIVPWIVFTPLIGLLVNLFFGWRLKGDAAGWIATAAVGISFVIAAALGIGLIQSNYQPSLINPQFFSDWISIPSAGVYIPWQFRVDTLSVTMMLVVTGVGSLIHIYAVGYMRGDEKFGRFFIYLNLFIAFMLVLVTANNFLMLFVGWEGVGLCSFLLVGFWFDKRRGEGWRNSNAARKAFIVNRIGDFGFMLAILLIFWTFGTLDFTSPDAKGVFDLAPQWIATGTHLVQYGNVSIPLSTSITLITFFMLIGVTGKSAQLPLYVWLPDAMAGPTPVSALIHAATMVTAGVYLVVRSAVLYQAAPFSSGLMTLIGAATALYAGFIAIGQWDIKKVLAYSTVSQLGFMVAAAGVGAYSAAMFHLVTHAFFKGLLFLAAGSVIHGVEHGQHAAHDDVGAHGSADAHAPHGDVGVHGTTEAVHAIEAHDTESHDSHTATNTPIPEPADVDTFDAQDMRNMGGLRHRMPITFWVYLIGTLALSGIFPLAGFWSKDDILASTLWHAGLIGYIALALLILAAFCTAFYMWRQIRYVFLGNPRSLAAERAPESTPVMTVPLIILAVLATFGGLLNLPVVSFFRQIGASMDGLNQWLSHTIANLPDVPFSLLLAIFALLVAVGAIVLADRVYGRNNPLTKKGNDPLELPVETRGAFRLANAKLFADELNDRFIVKPFHAIADWLGGPVDRSGIDRGFIGLGGLVQRAAALLKPIETGFVRTYVFTMLLGVLLILFLILFPLLRQLAAGG